jgi:hypothetical protein
MRQMESDFDRAVKELAKMNLSQRENCDNDEN